MRAITYPLPGDIWQCLKIFVVVTTEGGAGVLLTAGGAEAREALKQPTMHIGVLHKKGIITPKMSVVQRLRNFA